MAADPSPAPANPQLFRREVEPDDGVRPEDATCLRILKSVSTPNRQKARVSVQSCLPQTNDGQNLQKGVFHRHIPRKYIRIET